MNPLDETYKRKGSWWCGEIACSRTLFSFLEWRWHGTFWKIYLALLGRPFQRKTQGREAGWLSLSDSRSSVTWFQNADAKDSKVVGLPYVYDTACPDIALRNVPVRSESSDKLARKQHSIMWYEKHWQDLSTHVPGTCDVSSAADEPTNAKRGYVIHWRPYYKASVCLMHRATSILVTHSVKLCLTGSCYLIRIGGKRRNAQLTCLGSVTSGIHIYFAWC